MEPYFRSLKLELTHLLVYSLAGWPKTEALKGQRNINLKKAFEARYSRPTMTRALNKTSFCIAHLVLEAITHSVIAKRITADGNNVSSRGKRPNSTQD
jgi:hypothetical protein